MTRQEIIAKITKCLALSASANPHEAALAVERARALMEKYDVTSADVELAGISSTRTAAHRGKRPPGHLHILVGLVKTAFGCEALFCPQPSFNEWRTEVEFIGFGAHPQIAAYAFEVLHRQMERGRRHFLGSLSKRMKWANKAAMAARWAEGWVLGVSEKVTAMALGDEDRRRIDQWIERRNDRLVTEKPRLAPKGGLRGVRAFARGLADGQDAHLHRGVQGQDRARLA